MGDTMNMPQPHIPAKPDLKDWLGLLALGLIWGSSFMVVSIATRYLGPLTIAAGRISLGAVTLLALSRILRIPLPRLAGPNGWRIWAAALGLGFFSMALPFFLLSWGQARVASGFAGVSMAMSPLLTLVLAHFFVSGERMTGPKVVGISLGFLGVVLLIGFDAFNAAGYEGENLARLACAGAAASYAVGAVLTRRAPPVDPIAFASAATLLATAIILPLALAVEGLPRAPGLAAVLSILYLGLIPTALANLLLVAVIRSAGPSFISLVNYQVPLWSVLFGWAFLNESLPPRVFAALGLILTGVALSQLRLRRSRG